MSRNQSVDWGYGATNIGYIKERKQFTTFLGSRLLPARCYKYRIYQRTKAIHNYGGVVTCFYGGATNIGYIKERKQFTTELLIHDLLLWCYKYRIYQRTKAIHNVLNDMVMDSSVLQI